MDVLRALFPPRRNVGIGHESSPVWYRSRPVYWAVLYTIVFVALAGMIALTARDRPRFASNTIAQQPIVARVSFTAENKAATEEARADAFQREPAVYVPNAKYFSELRERLNSLMKLASDPSIQTVDQIPDSAKYLEIKPETLALLRKLIINGQPTPQWNFCVNQFFNDFEHLAILSTFDAARETDPHQRAPKIAIQTPSSGEAIVYDNLIIPVNSIKELRSRVQRLAETSFVEKPLWTTMTNLVTIHVLPTYNFDPDASKSRAKAARDREPAVLREYHANDVLIPAGKLLNQDTDVNLIELENRAYLEKVRKLSPMLPLLNDVGQLGTVLLVSLMVWGYIFAYNPKISKNPLRGLAITALLVGAQGVAVGATLSAEYRPCREALSLTQRSLQVSGLRAGAQRTRTARRRGGVLLLQSGLQDHAGPVRAVDADTGRRSRQRAVAVGPRRPGSRQSGARGGSQRHRPGAARLRAEPAAGGASRPAAAGRSVPRYRAL